MAKLIWSPNYAIGIDVIDRQHQRILDYINQVYDARAENNSHDILQDVLNNLVDYTYSHFEFEEALMEEAEYEELAEHKLTHKDFCHLINKLKQRFDHGEAVAEELADMLQKWLLKHIMTDDRSYAAVVKSRILHGEGEPHRNWVQNAISRYFQ